MRKAFAVLVMTAASLAAQASASTGTTAPKATNKAVAAKKATTAAPKPLTIPTDAVANGDGTYTWKDKQGKSWTFVKTPFGVMKSETSAAPTTTASSLTGVKAFDDGDKVRFERPSPFGPIKWEKNKTELTDDERNLLNSQAPSQTAKQE
jgi:Flp pilus assembly protein TadG